MRGVLNNTQLKVIAVVTMTIDHVGAYLLPQVPVLRWIGRLAFPIFAYLVAEGCYYTSSKSRHLATMCAFGAVSQLVYWMAKRDLYQSIFTTFVLSAVTIYVLQWWADAACSRSCVPADKSVRCASSSGELALGACGWLNLRLLAPLAMLAVDVVATVALPQALGLGFYVQYRLPGVLLPVAAYLPRLFMAPVGSRPATLPVAAPVSPAPPAGSRPSAAPVSPAGTQPPVGSPSAGLRPPAHAADKPTAWAEPQAGRVLSLVLFAVMLAILCATAAQSYQWWALVALVPLALYNGKRGRYAMKYFFYVYYPLHLAILFALADMF